MRLGLYVRPLKGSGTKWTSECRLNRQQVVNISGQQKHHQPAVLVDEKEEVLVRTMLLKTDAEEEAVRQRPTNEAKR